VQCFPFALSLVNLLWMIYSAFSKNSRLNAVLLKFIVVPCSIITINIVYVAQIIEIQEGQYEVL